ncbi:MAG: hypothetical protein HEQ14_01565 [Aphanizomenon flos-aquae CP01]|jgi:glycosyltransferase involved in cell wall biosynthesis|nr:hypothetical protein [Aphanizomenon flos-aquae CP01]
MVHLLVGINNNSQQWVDALEFSTNRPRLPLPYGFGAGFYQNGHHLSAVDFSSSRTETNNQNLFKSIHKEQNIVKALGSVDAALLWASEGIKATFKQAWLQPPRRKVILASYVWNLDTLPNIRLRRLGIATHWAALFAKALVVMTSEQKQMARQMLPAYLPVIKFTCGIDTKFYRSQSDWVDVPESERKTVENLLRSPYVIMPGDEQRCHSHALEILTHSNLRLVRISQYSKDKDAKWFRQEIYNRGLTERCFFFERISYPFLRFLLHHASVYAGLVDSTWQPAGWTVACEALASGLPIVLYQGLVSNELSSLGAGQFLHSIPMGDTRAFQIELESLVSQPKIYEINREIQNFAAKNLDLEKTGELFVKEIAHIFI